jgi:heptosyltransferase-2
MDVFVSNDSGAMHLAAALGRPVVAIFGPTDERATRPLGDHTVVTAPVFCRPCMLRDCPIDHRCMKRISVDEVFEAVTARLGPGVVPA